MTTLSDAANESVRAFLAEVSNKRCCRIGPEYRQQAVDFFGGNCALTGQPLGVIFDLDHLVPASRKHLGLYVPGNLAPVTREANSLKSGKSCFEFFDDHPEHRAQRQRVLEWMDLHRFDPRSGEHLRVAAEHLYRLTQDLIRGFAAALNNEETPPAEAPLYETEALGIDAKPKPELRIGEPTRPYLILQPNTAERFLERLNATGRARVTAFDAAGVVLVGWPKIWKTKGVSSTTQLRHILWSRPDLRTEARNRDGIFGVEVLVLER